MLHMEVKTRDYNRRLQLEVTVKGVTIKVIISGYN